MIKYHSLEIPDVKILRTERFVDERGYFTETYNRRAFAEIGIDLEFVQDNHSLTVDKGTVRGLHFQAPPYAQDKLVRVIRGKILDVAVDIRRSSKTFGKHVSAVIDAEEGDQILVPKGFAHGFLTLMPETEVVYKVTNYYSREHDMGLAWNDPDLGIEWGIHPRAVTISDKDRNNSPFHGFESPFD